MRPTLSRFLALASVLLAAPLVAAVRPRYGETLRVETRSPMRTLDPADPNANVRVAKLLFETLISLDDSGRVQPVLAVSWQRDARRRHWQFRLRPGVTFHDGTPLTPAAVAASLAGSAWTATATADGVSIDSEHPISGLLSELASIRKSIVVRGPDGTLAGTGPFRVEKWEPNRRVLLKASEDYWGGRPFVDAVSIDCARLPQEQLLDLELDKADIVELSPAQVRRAQQAGRRLWSSGPVTLLALRFERGRPAADDARVREALAWSIDRAAICGVLLQKQGQPAQSLLPQEVSGYAFLYSGNRDLARARRAGPPPIPLVLGYDASDPLARSIADRIAVDSRETGLKVIPDAAGRADVRLVRARLNYRTPIRAFNDLAASLQIGVQRPPATLEALHAAESAVLDEYRVVPLAYLPEILGLGSRVRTWLRPGLTEAGDWQFEDVWLDASPR